MSTKTRPLGTITIHHSQDSRGREFVRTEVRLPDGSTRVAKERIRPDQSVTQILYWAIERAGETIADYHEPNTSQDEG